MSNIQSQILYAYSPDKLTLYESTPEGAYRETEEWYPGDEYVDIIGTDCYHFGGAEGTEDYLRRAHRQLDAAAQLAKEHHKRLAFTETGCESVRCPHWYTEVLLPLLREYPTIEYVLVWRNAWDIPHHFFLPQPNTAEAEDFKTFIQQL
jgi:mannan endo-1,4-beta-mannosidase